MSHRVTALTSCNRLDDKNGYVQYCITDIVHFNKKYYYLLFQFLSHPTICIFDFDKNYFLVLLSGRPQIMVYQEIHTKIYLSQYARVG